MFAKQLILFAAFLALSIPCAYSAVLTGIQKEDPGNPGACSAKVDDKTISIPVGTSFHDTNQCWEHKCSENETPGYLTYRALTCGVIGTPQGCKVTEIKVGKNYPDCCPMLTC